MKVEEMRKMNVAELQKEHIASLQEQFNLRMQRAAGQMSRSHLFKDLRRKIARLQTIINEKQLAGNA